MRIQSSGLGGYKMFKGVAMSDAAFRAKYGRTTASVQPTVSNKDEQEMLALEAMALLLELELLELEDGLLPQTGNGAFVHRLLAEIALGTKHNKLTLEKLAAGYGISNRNTVKELTERAIVVTARKLAHEPVSTEEQYQNVVALYERQVNLSHRTSQSMLLQQYSTPAPIGYVAGMFCQLATLKEKGGYGFEPSAGNGLLTIAGSPDRFYVNEIDEVRHANLEAQGFLRVLKQDACKPFAGLDRKFAAVLTNPPFGTLDTPVAFNGFKIKTLDHAMALYALETMKDDGYAAIIIGGHTRWDAYERIQEGKNLLLFNYLYHHFKVADVINISGKKLYSRQGTGFDVRLILVAGRKQTPEGAAPLRTASQATVVATFDELFRRVREAQDRQS